MTGSIEEAIPLDEQAIRLSPGDPYLQNYYQDMGIIYLLLSRSNEAIVWFEKARHPGLDWPYSFLAAIYALRGESEKAAANLAEAGRLCPDGRYSSIARRKATGISGPPGYWGCQRSLPCSKPIISPGCARPACPRNNGLDPRSCRDPRRRCGDLPTRRATSRGRSNPISA